MYFANTITYFKYVKFNINMMLLPQIGKSETKRWNTLFVSSSTTLVIIWIIFFITDVYGAKSRLLSFYFLFNIIISAILLILMVYSLYKLYKSSAKRQKWKK